MPIKNTPATKQNSVYLVFLVVCLAFKFFRTFLTCFLAAAFVFFTRVRKTPASFSVLESNDLHNLEFLTTPMYV